MTVSSVGLSTVRFGLRIMQLGMLSVTLTVCTIAWLSLTGFAAASEDILHWLLGIGIALPAVLFCIGSFPLMAAPTRSGARKFALLAMLFAHLQLIVGLFAVPFIFLIVPVIGLACASVLFHVCFLLCLNRLSLLTDRTDLHAATTGLLIRILTVPLALFSMSAAGMALAPQLVSEYVGVVWIAAVLIYSVRYTMLISSVCNALRTAE